MVTRNNSESSQKKQTSTSDTKVRFQPRSLAKDLQDLQQCTLRRTFTASTVVLTHIIYSVDKKQHCGALFVAFSKAFGYIWSLHLARSCVREDFTHLIKSRNMGQDMLYLSYTIQLHNISVVISTSVAWVLKIWYKNFSNWIQMWPCL